MVRFLTLAALTLSGTAVSLAASHSGKPSIGIFLDFDALPTGIAMDAMKKEVGEILKPTGVAVGWRWLKENKGIEAFSALIVVRFKGKCQVQPWDDAAARTGGAVTLATTQVSEGNVLPFSEVACDELTRTVDPPGPEMGEQERQSALGRAMGRVLAHELYHVLARTTEHAAHGLAQASHPFGELVSGPLHLQQRDAARMRQGLR